MTDEKKQIFGFEQAMAEGEAADKILTDIATGTPPPGTPDPPAPAAPAPEPVPAETPVVEPVPSDQKDLVINALKEGFEEAKQAERKAVGRLKVQADENKVLKDTIMKLEDRIKELEKVTPAPATPIVSSNSTIVKTMQDDFGLTTEAASRFENIVQDAIASGVTAKLAAMGIKPGETPPTPPSATSKEEPSDDKDTSLSLSDWRIVNSLVGEKELTAIMNYDAGGVAQGSPELTHYFAQVDPKTRMTNGEMARQAIKYRDPVSLAAIYNEFKAVMASKGRPIRPIAPNTGSKGGGGQGSSKPTYSLAEADKYRVYYRDNVGSWSVEQLAEAKKIMDMYDQADYEGRLV